MSRLLICVLVFATIGIVFAGHGSPSHEETTKRFARDVKFPLPVDEATGCPQFNYYKSAGYKNFETYAKMGKYYGLKEDGIANLPQDILKCLFTYCELNRADLICHYATSRLSSKPSLVLDGEPIELKF